MPDLQTALLLRDCSLADIPAVTAIYAHAVRHGRASFELEPPGEAEMAERWTRLHDGGYPFLVAESDGAVAGYAYAGPYRPRPAYRATVENSVYVAERQQGCGIGRALLWRLIDETEKRGFRQMVAVIGDSGNHASIRLHRQAGFNHVGTLRSVGWKHETWLDTVLMQRPLGMSDSQPLEIVQP